MNKSGSLFCALLVTSLGLVSPAHAGRPDPAGWALSGPNGAGSSHAASGDVRLAFQSGASFQTINQIVPLGQVLDMINSVEPGVQLDTRLISENGRPFYIVRWQASRGRIIIFKIDAQTGSIVGRQG
ncbi:hypothetical protein PbB2_01878 [Candidatus Phycosocius bacilliformis]|uniref:PepSY domain-containing protein n=1 Tax=Candidatus Phycosocius bacilliformis TaxID=1445552 RepID=A0A2P2EAV2_9PROT|nr:hypothetical protein [Candidatus Phycosocius bacilliformis]GBF58206.1 hypothetical protein PbB2_01878 [Candidatus Phycosocius bacilliformis]